MHTQLARLLALRAQLYLILALLLALVAGLTFRATRSAPTAETQWFCGTEAAPDFQTPEYQAGKTLFAANCASCHNKNMKDNLTGPALGGVSARWAAFPRGDLYRWIRRSQEMIGAGHPRAQELWQIWKPTVMNDFPDLSDEQIEQILAYIGS